MDNVGYVKSTNIIMNKNKFVNAIMDFLEMGRKNVKAAILHVVDVLGHKLTNAYNALMWVIPTKMDYVLVKIYARKVCFYHKNNVCLALHIVKVAQDN